MKMVLNLLFPTIKNRNSRCYIIKCLLRWRTVATSHSWVYRMKYSSRLTSEGFHLTKKFDSKQLQHPRDAVGRYGNSFDNHILYNLIAKAPNTIFILIAAIATEENYCTANKELIWKYCEFYLEQFHVIILSAFRGTHIFFFTWSPIDDPIRRAE